MREDATREIVLDTETTGLDPDAGDRIIEIGCVELVNRMPTGANFHRYINPERGVSEEAVAIHGLTEDFLADQPVFADIVAEFLNFIGSDVLIMHNAAFDVGFIDAECARQNIPPLAETRVIDTLAMARRRFPGSPASLDALCRRFGVDNSKREKHGALCDAELLAEVYLELSGGRQPGLVFNDQAPKPAEVAPAENTETAPRPATPATPRPTPLPERLTAAERDAHAVFLESLPKPALWGRGARK